MKLPPPSEDPSKAPSAALVVMGVILVGMALVAVYSNVQRFRRDKIETVIVTPIPTPGASPSQSPR